MKKAGQIIGAGLVGLIAGAASTEVIRRRPELLANAWKSTKETFKTFADAFREGYQGKFSNSGKEPANTRKLPG